MASYSQNWQYFSSAVHKMACLIIGGVLDMTLCGNKTWLAGLMHETFPALC